MKKIFLLFIVFITAVLILFPTPSAAQFGKAIQKLDSAAGNTGLTKDLEGSVGNVISAVLSIVGTIFFALTVYAGIRWMTARGNEEEVTKAQEIIKAAVIGLVITMAAYAITAFVTGRLGGGSGGGNTTQGCCQTGKFCYTMTDTECSQNNGIFSSGKKCIVNGNTETCQ